MSLLALGLSHHTAPMRLLERAALEPKEVLNLLRHLAQAQHLAEAAVVATCNRVEIYAEVMKFHGGVTDSATLLAEHTGVDLAELTPHLFAYYDDEAVQHLFEVVCGLDSMVVGEGQILGQVKGALEVAQRMGTAGRTLNELMQQALRVGKRAHAETGIAQTGHSLVSVGVAQAEQVLGPISGCSVLVVGAGSASVLAASILRRAGAGELMIANRTYSRGEAVAESVAGRAIPLSGLADVLTKVDLVVSCTGATDVVLGVDVIEAAMAARNQRPLVLLDLALPRDIDPAAQNLPGLTLIDLDRLAAAPCDDQSVDIAAVQRIIAEELADFTHRQCANQVAPTVTALRSMAAEVVQTELTRLSARLPRLDPQSRAEVARTVRRVVDKLLHAPTVRVKQFASGPGGASYAHALRDLFDLDSSAVAAVAAENRVDGLLVGRGAS